MRCRHIRMWRTRTHTATARQEVISREPARDIALAKRGDLDAIHRLCYDMVGERGLPRDGGRARAWCAAAAERGNAFCQTLYAQLLQSGEGAPPTILKLQRDGIRRLQGKGTSCAMQTWVDVRP